MKFILTFMLAINDCQTSVIIFIIQKKSCGPWHTERMLIQEWTTNIKASLQTDGELEILVQWATEHVLFVFITEITIS